MKTLSRDAPDGAMVAALFARLAPSFPQSVSMALNAPLTMVRVRPKDEKNRYGIEISNQDSHQPWLECALAHEIEVLQSYLHATEPTDVSTPARLSETFDWKKFIDQQAVNLLVYRLTRDRGEVIALYRSWLERNAQDFGPETEIGQFFQKRAKAL